VGQGPPYALPVALQAHQPGHEIEGPMAIVILGGLVSSTLVTCC